MKTIADADYHLPLAAHTEIGAHRTSHVPCNFSDSVFIPISLRARLATQAKRWLKWGLKKLTAGDLWAAVELMPVPYSPCPKGGRPFMDNRDVLTAISFVFRPAYCRWRFPARWAVA